MKNLFCIPVFLLALSPGICPASERQGNVEMTVNITAPEESRDVRVWIPYPVSNDTQDITDVKVDGNYSRSGIYREKETGNLALYANWEEPEKQRVITLTFNARAEELVRRDFPDEEQSDTP